MLDEPSGAREAEIAAILTRLREGVRGAPPSRPQQADDGARSIRLAARAEAERLWPVMAERPFACRPGPLGRIRALLLVPLKLVLRKLMRWYVEPAFADQRAFNAVALKLLDDLAGQASAGLERVLARADDVAGQTARIEQALDGARGDQTRDERLLAEVDERLVRLERRDRSRAPAERPQPSAPLPQQASLPDYFAFESRMRGPAETVRKKQEVYVEDFRETAPVLDVGCGRGEFLELLREAGIEARGVDLDSDMVAYCRGSGLEVEQREALEYLQGLEDGSLGGIFAAQFVEHLRPSALVRFLELAAAKLRPGGILVAETINPRSLTALKHYFADLTHAQPLVPETLVLLARQAGFRQADVRFLNEPEEGERLRPVELPSDPAFGPARAALAANIERLNETIFGPQDYALIARP